jgi:thimet oligopeptidase
MGPGELLGRVYLDMWPRNGKYQHAAQFELRSGVAGKQAPEGVLMTNFPAAGSMEHSQVETFFHEFGHLMHHVVGGANSVLQAYSGVATEWDFVEAPSQMLEAWAWDTRVLQAFASNSTGGVIPVKLVSQMVAASALGRAMGNQQQVFYSQLSLQLHTEDPARFRDDAQNRAGNDTTSTFIQALQMQWSPFPFVSGTAFQASFGHLVGYGAIYSTYLWSNVIARDLLSAFDSAPFKLLDAKIASSYTERIIAQGGRADASKLLDSFLQRPVQFGAFQAWVSAGASAQCTTAQ